MECVGWLGTPTPAYVCLDLQANIVSMLTDVSMIPVKQANAYKPMITPGKTHHVQCINIAKIFKQSLIDI